MHGTNITKIAKTTCLRQLVIPYRENRYSLIKGTFTYCVSIDKAAKSCVYVSPPVNVYLRRLPEPTIKQINLHLTPQTTIWFCNMLSQ